MTEKLQKIIKEEIEKLPKEKQEAISSVDWTKIAEEIAKKHLLAENEINDLQVETLLVLIGLVDGNYYAQNIENQIGMTKDEAEKISEEALEKIFTPIINKLIEKLKEDAKNKDLNWDKNLNFVLSGGDYASLVDIPAPQEDETPISKTVTKSPNTTSNPKIAGYAASNDSKIAEIKDKFLYDDKSKIEKQN